MKTKLTSKAAAIAAFISLIQVAQAETTTHSFTPLEDLPPEQRQKIAEKINELSNEMQIDWEQFAIGVNEEGKIVFILKKDANLSPTINPSCFGVSKSEKSSCE